MENYTKLIDPEDIDEYIHDLWRTDIFRQSHEESGYVGQLVDRLKEKPQIFFEMEDPSVEWSQFTTWMGALALRGDHYDNDAVHDLYYLHEFWHRATMPYRSDYSFPEWYKKMASNEMKASVHSECYVYFALEGLREKSFDFEIWVDRFLEGRRLTDQWEDPFMELYRKRREVMESPDPFDFLEMQVHHFAMQNVQWANIWSDSWREVEEHMEEFHMACDYNREEALDVHIEWLEEKKGSDVTPYQEEAEAFAKIVEENKKRQGNQVLES